jgi:hypothetical protein
MAPITGGVFRAVSISVVLGLQIVSFAGDLLFQRSVTDVSAD